MMKRRRERRRSSRILNKLRIAGGHIPLEQMLLSQGEVTPCLAGVEFRSLLWKR
jgi:hypothetical protein